MSLQIPVLELESEEVREIGQDLQGPEQSNWARIRAWSPSWLAPLFHSKKAIVGMVILLVYISLAILAPVISPGDPKAFVARPHQPPSSEHWLGTTGLGRDVWAQTIWGARFTLEIGFLVGIATTLVGCGVGMTAGYFRGRIDDVLSLFMNVFLIIPTIPLLVVLAAFVGSKDLLYFVAVLTLTGWAWPARVIRSQTLSLREKDFVAASVVVGKKVGASSSVRFCRICCRSSSPASSVPPSSPLAPRRRSNSSVSAIPAGSVGAPISIGPKTMPVC